MIHERYSYQDGGANTGELDPRPERSLLEERQSLEINPQILMDVNHSSQARHLIQQWGGYRDRGELILIDICGDARTFEDHPQNKIVMPSIASSGPLDPFLNVYQDPNVKAIVDMSHYASTQFVPGENPGGCGGRAGKAAQKNGLSAEEGDVHKYIREHVLHEDVAVNSLRRAARIAHLTGKPTMSSVQDHITGELKPLAFFMKDANGFMDGKTAIPYDFLFEGGYDPKKIYENDVPSLPIGSLPDIFAEIKAQNQEHIKELDNTYNDFRKAQEVQNPTMLLLSTSLKPPEIRYPGIFPPGSLFSLSFGKDRVNGDQVIDPKSIREGLRQAHYSILHSVTSHGTDGQFSALKRILIETPHIDLSLYLATELAEKDWMQPWMELYDHRIMIGATNRGVSEGIQYLT